MVCFIATAYGPVIRKHIIARNNSRLELAIGYLFEYLLKLLVMILMMSMNGWVLLAIALGTALGSSIFSMYGLSIRRRLFKIGVPGVIEDSR